MSNGSFDKRICSERHDVSNVYNHWSYMSPLNEQHQWMQSFTAPFTALRLLTPLKMSYEVAKKRAESYTKIVGKLPEMRRDTVDGKESDGAYVIVNNRSEGNASLTIQVLVGM